MSADTTPRARTSRRVLAVGFAVAAVAVPVGVYSLTAEHGSAGRSAAAPQAGADFHAYVAAIGNEVVEFDTASGKLLAGIGVRDSIGSTVLDSPVSIAATPDGSQVFTADQGKSSVLAIATATGATTEIELGGGPPPGTTTVPLHANALSSAGFPEGLAVSPDGSSVYVTVTGPPNTGPGGPHELAVISTATDTVTGSITIRGDSPRQVIFSPDGRRAYVTTEQSIDVVDTATRRLVASIPDTSPGGPQDLTISPDGRTVYVTNPVPGTLTEISTASNRVRTVLPAGDEPYAVAVSPDSKSVYVTDMNSDSVRVINALTNRTITNIGVHGLPGSVAFTPDGSQVWVGNILQGDISVIDPATNTVARTVAAGLPAQETIDAAPISFAFVATS